MTLGIYCQILCPKKETMDTNTRNVCPWCLQILPVLIFANSIDVIGILCCFRDKDWFFQYWIIFYNFELHFEVGFAIVLCKFTFKILDFRFLLFWEYMGTLWEIEEFDLCK